MACSRTPKWKLRPAPVCPSKSAPLLQGRVRRHAEIRVASDELRQPRRDRVLDFPGGRARRLLFAGLEDRQLRVPSVGKDAPERAAATRTRARGTSFSYSEKRLSQSCCCSLPRPRASRKRSSASGGTKKGSFHSQPSACLVRTTSSLPSGLPWASDVPALFGDPNPSVVRTRMIVGRFCSSLACAIASSIASRSVLPSSTRKTCHP